MSKQIITAETVRAAWQAGQSSITLAPGDIVTQQARDDARQHGIVWKDAASAPPAATPAATQTVPTPTSEDARCTPSDPVTSIPASARAGLSPEQMVAAVTTQLQEALAPIARALAIPQGYLPGVAPASVLYTPGINPMSIAAVPAASTAPAASLVTPLPVQTIPMATIAPVAAVATATPSTPVATAPVAGCAQPESAELAALTAEVQRRVLAALPAGVTADSSLMDQLIRKVLSDNPCTTCTCDACSAKGGSPVSETPPTGKLPGLEQVGGVMHVSSKAQAWGNGGSRDSVSMMDVLSPSTGAAAAVGYLEWDSLTFSWTFERPEVLVVLEGELKLTLEGTTLCGAAGDVFSIPKGVEVALSSTGHVKCTTVGNVAA